ncbi:hypothetical protein BV898_18232 [Hypsibius exemplaris]|uniref:Uncharacterized protein n=1 Tax=Hypsibius exemplaris TaxID=2072580 RepID=A0A9X6RN96_HYPEX|nr:hypothetical protein BV898_18232 [Hypsibius exemplaris]
MKEWLAELGIAVSLWAAKSPYFSVIENIWGHIKLLLQSEEILMTGAEQSYGLEQGSNFVCSPAATTDINIRKLLDKERSRVTAKAKKEEKEKEADAKEKEASQKAFDDAQKKRFQ